MDWTLIASNFVAVIAAVFTALGAYYAKSAAEAARRALIKMEQQIEASELDGLKRTFYDLEFKFNEKRSNSFGYDNKFNTLNSKFFVSIIDAMCDVYEQTVNNAILNTNIKGRIIKYYSELYFLLAKSDTTGYDRMTKNFELLSSVASYRTIKNDELTSKFMAPNFLMRFEFQHGNELEELCLRRVAIHPERHMTI